MGAADGSDSHRKQKKAPPMNFGLVARIPTQREMASVVTEQSSTRQQPGIQAPAAAAVIAQVVTRPIAPTATAGFVRSQATTINARTESEGNIKLAPAIVFGTPEDFPPLVVRPTDSTAGSNLCTTYSSILSLHYVLN